MYTEEQYDIFAKKMEAKYSKMFEGKYGGFAVDAGWWPIIESLCANIQGHIDWQNNQRIRLLEDNKYNHLIPDEISQVVVEQIKEKFGGLRFYYQGGDETIRGMVRMAEAWADHSCEVCGRPGEHRNGGWIKTLCDEHDAERKERYKRDFSDET